jgi:hypothetical protein
MIVLEELRTMLVELAAPDQSVAEYQGKVLQRWQQSPVLETSPNAVAPGIITLRALSH